MAISYFAINSIGDVVFHILLKIFTAISATKRAKAKILPGEKPKRVCLVKNVIDYLVVQTIDL